MLDTYSLICGKNIGASFWFLHTKKGRGRSAIRVYFISGRLDQSNEYWGINLWGSKFPFFHADSGIGLKHNFEAVFEAIRGRFVIKKPVWRGSRRCKGLIFYVAGSFYATVFMSMFLRPKLRFTKRLMIFSLFRSHSLKRAFLYKIMASRLVMTWLYFSILALHTKYEP